MAVHRANASLWRSQTGATSLYYIISANDVSYLLANCTLQMEFMRSSAAADGTCSTIYRDLSGFYKSLHTQSCSSGAVASVECLHCGCQLFCRSFVTGAVTQGVDPQADISRAVPCSADMPAVATSYLALGTIRGLYLLRESVVCLPITRTTRTHLPHHRLLRLHTHMLFRDFSALVMGAVTE